MDKIAIFTHTDLDGVVSPFILEKMHRIATGNSCEYTVYYCETGKNGTIDSSLEDFMKKKELYKKVKEVYVLDLAPSTTDLAERLGKFCNDKSIKLMILDHHKTALPIKDVISEQSIISVEKRGLLMSGTMLAFSFMSKGIFGTDDIYRLSALGRVSALYDLASIVRSYDTWDWHNNKNDIYKEKARDFNALFFFFGREAFIERLELLYKENESLINFSQSDLMIINALKQKAEDYINYKLNEAQFGVIDVPSYGQMTYALVDGEQNISELGNSMASSLNYPDTNKKVDFAVVRCGTRLSFRAVKDDIDVSIVAKMFNGGGHSKAAGGKGRSHNLI